MGLHCDPLSEDALRSNVLALALGIVAGLTGGLFGIGGGLVAVPGLVLLLRMAQHRAHATSVTAIIATASAALLPFAFANEIQWRTSGLLTIGAIVGAVIGAGLMGRVGEVTLARAFVALTVVAGIRLVMLSDSATESLADPTSLSGAFLLLVTGLAAGTLAALLGVGGGVVFVPALVVLFGLEQHLAQGTSLAAIVPTTIIASIRHARHGRVDWNVVVPLAAGGVAGGILGATLALDLAPGLLRRLFVALLVIVSIRMVQKTRRIQV